MGLTRIEWDAKKARNAALERRAKVLHCIPKQGLKPGNGVIGSNGTKYRIMPDGSWRRI